MYRTFHLWSSLIFVLLAAPARADGSLGDAYDVCAQILSQGVYDDKLYQSDINAAQFMVAQACKTMTSYDGADDARWSEACSNAGSDQGAGINVDVPIDGVPIGIGGDYQSGSTSGWCGNAGSRAAYRHAWYDHMCTSSLASSNLGQLTNQVLKTVDPNVVGAWQACVTQRYQGLTCTGRQLGPSGLQLDVAYDPAPTGADHLSLAFQVASGLTAPAPLPAAMGRGNLKIDFALANLTDDLDVVVTGSAQDGGQQACDFELPPQERKVCAHGELVGSVSGRSYPDAASLCQVVDACELSRLRAIFDGHYASYDDYAYDQQNGYAPVYLNGRYQGIGPCN